jgi:di/tricarboxylate transporter
MAVMLFFFISEKIRIDLTAIGGMVALMITGILTPKEAVAGFSSPAVITVGAMFLISQAMIRSGAVELISEHLVTFAGGRIRQAMLIILFVVAMASAFINNTPVVVLFIPVVFHLCCHLGMSPSKFLIPISYASILAGTCTLIGTSTNIIVSDLSAAAGYGSLGMFELSKVGVPVAVIGIVFLVWVSPRWMPSLVNPSCELENEERRRYLAEMAIQEGSRLVGLDPAADLGGELSNVVIVELIRDGYVYHPGRDRVSIESGDRLLVKGSATSLIAILNEKAAILPQSEEGLTFSESKIETVAVELIIPPQSIHLGRRLEETGLLDDPNFHVVAIRRTGLHYSEQQIHQIELKVGDILLVWATVKAVIRLREGSDLIVVDDVHHRIFHKKKAKIAGAIFLAMMICAGFGLADIMTCALSAVFFLILTGCVQFREGYRAIQGEVLILIIGTMALGAAMEKTGASRIYAEAFLSALEGYSPRVMLAGILILTSLSSQLLSNNATAVLLLPIALSAASTMGVHPKPFVIAVAIGASACFATPIGYKTNLLVYGPGGYRFSDYLKLGIPMNLIVIGMAIVLIPYFWPL